nr:PREDICTED: olfactory receptor 52E2-like [Latimeria chalumnae]|eukprot:XP_006013898.2 PREDICTED: olfactory receptor 52E2-like [Latimeria chalumnae]
MTTSNSSIFRPEIFILVGIPGLQLWYPWISIPFTIIYLVALVGNFLILLIIRIEQSLHEPMYFFLCMLAAVDLVLCTVALPKMLAIFWLDITAIILEYCFIQMTFIHIFTVLESATMVLMAYDRFVVISKPLYYSTILTNSLIGKLVLLCLVRAVLLFMPQFIAISRLPYCSSVIPYCYCDYTSLLNIAFNRSGKTLSSEIHALVASSSVLVPPALNPLIYGLRTKEIRQGFSKLVKRGKISSGAAS